MGREERRRHNDNEGMRSDETGTGDREGRDRDEGDGWGGTEVGEGRG